MKNEQEYISVVNEYLLTNVFIMPLLNIKLPYMEPLKDSPTGKIYFMQPSNTIDKNKQNNDKKQL